MGRQGSLLQDQTEIEPSMSPMLETRIPEISEDLEEDLGLAYCGELWTDTTQPSWRRGIQSHR